MEKQIKTRQKKEDTEVPKSSKKLKKKIKKSKKVKIWENSPEPVTTYHNLSLVGQHDL